MSLAAVDLDNLSVAEQWALLSPEEREEVLALMDPKEALEFTYDWNNWARPDQHLPTYNPNTGDGNWFCWALISGRGAGKTRTGAETVRTWVGKPTDPPIRIALVAESAADARDVLIEGDSGILSVSPPWNMPEYSPSKRRLTWPNGSVAIHFSGDKPDQLRGPQFHKGWVDEIAKFQYPDDVWDNLELGLRLGTKPQAIVTTTPRPIPLINRLLADPMTVITRVSTYANLAHLAPTFIARVLERYEGTRLGRQELHAEVLSDTPGALWNSEMLEDCRASSLPEMARVVVGIDPAVSAEENSDEVGIVVCGKGVDGLGHVIKDLSGVYSPRRWASIAVKAFHEYGASRFVVEKNQGGNMILTVLETAMEHVPARLVPSIVHEGRRAEPIAALYEQGKIKHHGMFAEMEDQMIVTTRDGYEGGGSPDRMDAMVHAMRDLMMGAYTNPDVSAYADSKR